VDGDDSARFGARLRTCRAAARLSQQDLADRSGLSIRAIRNMERGRTQWPYRDSLTRLADALGLEEPVRAEFLACVPRRRLALRSPTADQAAADPGPGIYPTGNGNRVIPRQLPTSARPFTGRATELTALDQLLSHCGPDEPGTAIISAIGGTAGVGKTALALRWAHQVADRFPDGQLYVNLRGYDTGEPVRAETVQASFLRALGMPGPDIPAGAEERSAAYRSLLAGRKMLIVLDNACRVDQVRPLLPAGPSCVTLVTSRDSLAGLIARDGAIPVVLDLLPLTDAVGLLTELIGDRAAADPDATARLAICCCRLPLALRVAAELVTVHPQDPLAQLAAELASWQRSLDLLEAGGDDRTAIREVFSWSVRHLKPRTACAFALAALHPGTDLDAWALAAMAGTGYLQADRMLRELARAHLVQPTGDSRYGMHDLLRAFGRELCAADDAMIDTDAAVAGLLCYLQRGAAAAMDILHPVDAGQRPRPAGPTAGLPPATAEQQARTWLDTERETLIAAIRYAADHGRPIDAVNLADIIARYLDLGGFFTEAITVHSSAICAARLAGDPRAEARALLNLADIRVRRSQYEDALGCYQRARDLGRLAGDQLAGHRELNGLARINRLQGRYLEAAGYYQQILDLGRSSGNQHQQIVGLIGLGTTAIFTGQYQQATRWLEDAVGIAGTIGEQILRAAALLNMGNLRILQGRYQQAADHLQECRAICRDAGDQVIAAYALCHLVQADVRRGMYRQPESEAQLREVLTRFGNSGNQNAQILALFCLGELQLRFGRYREAHESLEQAIAICDKTGALQERAETLSLIGEVFLATGEPAQARARLTDALALASQIGDLLQQAHAHRGLANAETALSNEAIGRWHREQALGRYTALGIPEAGQLRSQLTAST
jgi:tetratricopeptide (TPR) repeat protein/transcriptional regulator with XRE-family HTH domain